MAQPGYQDFRGAHWAWRRYSPIAAAVPAAAVVGPIHFRDVTDDVTFTDATERIDKRNVTDEVVGTVVQ